MEENKYLNEEQYKQNSRKLKKIGKIISIVGLCLIVVGIIVLILGFIGFGKAGTNVASEAAGEMPRTVSGALSGFGLIVLGGSLGYFGMLAVVAGMIITVIGYRREIAAITTQQVMPVYKEEINEMTPTIGNAAGEIAKGIKKGLNEADKENG